MSRPSASLRAWRSVPRPSTDRSRRSSCSQPRRSAREPLTRPHTVRCSLTPQCSITEAFARAKRLEEDITTLRKKEDKQADVLETLRKKEEAIRER